MFPLFCEKGGTLFKGEHYLRKYGTYVEQCDGNKLMYFYVNNRSKSHEIFGDISLV